jgi:V8-like Glu-specific endopeptidase
MKRRLPSALASALLALLALGAVPTLATQSTNFNGTVALSNCSGAIIRWSTSVATDPALLLTNGHCYRLMGAHEVVVNLNQVRDVYLLKANGSDAGRVQTTKLLYATLWETDVALYKLGLTYKQIHKQFGVDAITLASSKPSQGDQSISIISGYWLTQYDCHMNGFAYRLHEYVYTWKNSIRYEDGGCQVIGGTSGSPVLDANRMEIGINNTRNLSGERCTLDNPCEENKNGKISVHEGRAYGQQTWMFYTCLSGNTLNLAKAGCKLPDR